MGVGTVELFEWIKLLVPVAASAVLLATSVSITRKQTARDRVDQARQSQLDKIDDRLEEINERITKIAEVNALEHAAVKAQVADVALSVANNYVRERDFTRAIAAVDASLIEVRKDVGAVHNRIDDVFRHGWRGADG